MLVLREMLNLKMTSTLPAGKKKKKITKFLLTFLHQFHWWSIWNKEDIYDKGTVRINRVRNCQLMEEKELKTKGASFPLDFRINQNDIIIIIMRWYDSQAGNLLSSFVGVEPLGNVRHWEWKSKPAYWFPDQPTLTHTVGSWEVLTFLICSTVQVQLQTLKMVRLHLVAHCYNAMDPLQKRPGEPAAQAESAALAKVSGFCWHWPQGQKSVGDHCPLQKQRQPLPGRGNPPRTAWIISQHGKPDRCKSCTLATVRGAECILAWTRTETVFKPSTMQNKKGCELQTEEK